MKNFETTRISTPGDHDLVITRSFASPRDIVFAAWTQAEQVAQWWDPAGLPLAVCKIDLRPNGDFLWVNQGPGQHTFKGTYREIVAPERIVFATRTIPDRPESVGTLIFSETQGRTLLTITMTCVSLEERNALLAMRIDVGTAKTIENLDAYLQARASAN